MVWCLSHGCRRIAFRNNSKVAPRSRKRPVKRCYFATPRDSCPTVEQIVPQAIRVIRRVYRLLVRGQQRFGAWVILTGCWRARELTEILWASRQRRAVPDKCAWNVRSSKEGSCICWLCTCMRRRLRVATALRASNRGRVSFEQRLIFSTGIPIQGSKQTPM